MFIIQVRTTAKDLRALPKYEFKDEYAVPIIKTYPRTVYYRGSDRHVLAGNRMAPDFTRNPKDAYKYDSEVEGEMAIDRAFHICSHDSLHGFWEVIPYEDADYGE